jgi:hypothetical protein
MPRFDISEAHFAEKSAPKRPYPPDGKPSGYFGWNSSTRLPDGSTIQICDPPGPVTMSSRRNFTPAARSRATSALMSETSK